MNDHLGELLQQAALLTRAGRPAEATALIQRALSGRAATGPAASTRETYDEAQLDETVIDGCVFEVAREAEAHETPAQTRPPIERERATADAGEFMAGIHNHAAITTAYKLYMPPGHAGRALPLVVMLHGCTQDPDDFATGTGMNDLAREQGVFVLYPEQPQGANPQRCWNWFKPTHQVRGHGEPAAIAALTQSIVERYGVDARRVYIAGLSAGGAMAHVVAQAYPEIFAAVGVHSGLASGAAGNVAEALSVMKSGASPMGTGGKVRGAAAMPHAERAQRPTIVFHGDADPTVHPRHGEHVVAAALGGMTDVASSVESSISARGRRYTRHVHQAKDARTTVEHWVVHGAGHAWSGGCADGSYTDPQGPDASAEMLRFFLAHPQT